MSRAYYLFAAKSMEEAAETLATLTSASQARGIGAWWNRKCASFVIGYLRGAARGVELTAGKLSR